MRGTYSCKGQRVHHAKHAEAAAGTLCLAESAVGRTAIALKLPLYRRVSSITEGSAMNESR